MRTGGFAGARLAATVDTSDLETAEATRVSQLVEGARFFEMQTASAKEGAPDRFEYRLLIESHIWGPHSVAFTEADLPEALRPLIDYLTAMARNAPGPASAADDTPAGS